MYTSTHSIAIELTSEAEPGPHPHPRTSSLSDNGGRELDSACSQQDALGARAVDLHVHLGRAAVPERASVHGQQEVGFLQTAVLADDVGHLGTVHSPTRGSLPPENAFLLPASLALI